MAKKPSAKGATPKAAAPPAITPAITPPSALKMPTPDPDWSCMVCAHYLHTKMTCIRHPPVPMNSGKYYENGDPIVVSAFPQMQPWGRCFDFTKRGEHPLGNAGDHPKTPQQGPAQ